jgi:uncharacterized membrane protein
MSSSALVLVTAVFLACAVEMVEALTIVFAVGHTRGWRSATEGVVAALATLALLVSGFGPALVRIPLSSLRLFVGSVLLIFGLQWLRKAILRATGLKAKHDEDEIYRETVSDLQASGQSVGRDRVAFTIAFKGVFLEGLEVVIAVLTLGASAHRLGLAVVSALAAILVVAATGFIVAKQLSKVPENAMKMSVGILLVSYGTFWSGEGIGVSWPGSDSMLLVLVAIYCAMTAVLVGSLRHQSPAKREAARQL